MNESQQILFMQIRILRMMAEKYSLSLKQASELWWDGTSAVAEEYKSQKN